MDKYIITDCKDEESKEDWDTEEEWCWEKIMWCWYEKNWIILMTDIICDCCGGKPDDSKIYKVKMNFIMDTINNPKKFKEWL